MSSWSRTAGVFAIVLAGWVMPATSVFAGVVFTVNSTLDQIDDDTTDGICHTAANTCTLRAAVMQANRMPNAGATIMLPAGTYTLTRPPSGSDDDDTGDLNLNTPSGYAPGPTTIIGAGAATTIIDANGIDRVLFVDMGRTVSISGISLRNGFTLSGGGGIVNEGALTVSYCTISDNTADQGAGFFCAGSCSLNLDHSTVSGNTATQGGGLFVDAVSTVHMYYSAMSGNAANNGGGIYTSGLLYVTISAISMNMSLVQGGGIYNDGSVSLGQSTLSSNTAVSSGGGIRNLGAFDVSQSTIASNTAESGGGIYSDGDHGNLFITNSTITLNSAAVDGGGISNASNGYTNIYNASIVFNSAGTDISMSGSGGGINNASTAVVRLRNSVVAENNVANSPIYDDCTGVLVIYGNNKFTSLSAVSGCTADPNSIGSSTVLTSLAELGQLQNNGGPTETVALVPPSDMIDGGDATLGCIDQFGLPLTTDQRGFPRVAGVRCDIGAFEYQDIIFANGFQ